ncbi:MAG: L,D-transpeptidase family protein [Beijerinckiaceae bacterium]
MRDKRPARFRQNSPRARLTRLRVFACARLAGAEFQTGRLVAGGSHLPCAIGRSGIGRGKREGDGKTPAGRFAIALFLFRPGGIFHPRRNFPARPIRRDDAWCDDPRDRNYNRPIRLPARPGRETNHEGLWRQDRLYDVVGILDYNIRPRICGRGSAIFFHLARESLSPTAGCVALRAADMRRLLPRLSRRVMMMID